jgi:hypothetical protein
MTDYVICKEYYSKINKFGKEICHTLTFKNLKDAKEFNDEPKINTRGRIYKLVEVE